MEHDVFISHSSKDAKIANAICEELEGNGIKCWIAPRNMPAGVTYSKHLVEVINASRIFLVVLSSHANESSHIVSEVNIAFSRKLLIVPVRVEDAPLSNSLEYYLSKEHLFDILGQNQEEHTRNLALTIKGLLENMTEDRQKAPGTDVISINPKPKGKLTRLKESAKMWVAFTLLVPALTVAYWQLAYKHDVKKAAEHIKEAGRLYEQRLYQAAIEECDKALAADRENQEALSLKQKIQNTEKILNRKE